MASWTKTVPLIGVLSTLAACGGGSGSETQQSISGASTKATITDQNAQQITTEAYKAAFAVVEQGNFGEVLALATGDTNNNLGPVSSGSQKTTGLAFPCGNGNSFSLILEDVAPEGVMSTNDSISLSYDGCQLFGTLLLGSADASLSDYTSSSDFTAEIFYSEFGVSIGNSLVTIDGDLVIDYNSANGTRTHTISSTGIEVINGSENYNVADYTAIHTLTGSDYTYEVDFELTGSAFSGTVTVETDPVFSGSGNEQCPSAGTMTITGDNGSITVNTDGGSSLILTIDDNGAITTNTLDCTVL